MQNIETDMTSPDPDLSGVSQEAIEAIVKEYVDANRESLRGPPGRSGTDGEDGEDGEDDEPGPPGPRGATGGEGSQGPQGEQAPLGADGADGVAGPRGATGEQGPHGLDGAQGPPDDTAPPESSGGFPWLPLQIAAGVLLGASLVFGAWSYLRRR